MDIEKHLLKEGNITNKIRSKNFTISAGEGWFAIKDKSTDMELHIDFKDKSELIKLLQRI